MTAASLSVRQIECISEVWLHRSMSAAARSLDVSQPLVSKMVRAAEERLGVKLFEMRSGRLEPTEGAIALLEEIQDIHGRMERLTLRARNLQKGYEGRLRIDALPGFVSSVVPAAVARFRQSHPRVTFSIHSIVDDEILPRLEKYETDLVIGAASVSHPQLEAISLGRGEIGIFYRRDAIQYPDRVPLEELNRVPVIGSPGMLRIIRQKSDTIRIDEETKSSVNTNQIAAHLVENGFESALVDSLTIMNFDNERFGFSGFESEIIFTIKAFYLKNRSNFRMSDEFLSEIKNVIKII